MIQIKKTILTLVALLAVTTGAWAAQVELKLGAKIKNGDVLTFGDTRVHFTTPCSLPYIIFSAVNTSTTARISYNDNVYSITFSPLVDAIDIEYPDVTQQGVGAALGLNTGQTQPSYVMVTEGTGTFADPFILTPYATYNCGGSPVDGKAICDASDPSALKVAWNKASKTGTFDMPGGNVTLEPDYYPQAALATEPTAINDVPATTDGAIVNAGTVANIGSTETAQGTVMYYVSTTALDDAALLALAADAWTADVPTAQSFTAAGTAYVYYYVRGNDSDTDDENFSDGDILAANALTVTIAAAPTYAVTFADDTAEPDKWTASPNTNVTKGETVTVTYSGTKKVLGVKAEKKAAAVPKAAKDATAEDVGKLIGADGNIYDDAGAATAANTTAVAKIFYVGSDNGEDAPYNHGLALALSDASNGCYWSTSSTKIHTYNPQNQNFTSESGLQYNDATHNSDTYPAFKAAITYSPAAPTGCSAWFLASGYQWKQMIGAAGLSNLGLTSSAYYWSSSEANLGSAWNLESTNGYWDFDAKGDDYRVRACLAF